MTEADLERVIRNETACHPDPWDRPMLRDSLAMGHVCRVLAKGPEPVGHGILRLTPPEAEVLNLCVHPEEWRQGHGRALLRDLLEQARAGGAAEVFLEVRQSNHRAQRLYSGEGFQQVGRRPAYYAGPRGREDGLIMGLHLRSAGL